VVLAVGRLDPVKGLDHLMRAMSQIAPSRPEATLLLAGKPGAASAQLHQLARSLRLNVRFLGHRDDVAELLAAADVLCLPSLREGFPGAALEAIAVGCPVIASDIPATREVLGPEYPASSFAPVGDVAALAAAIESQLANPSASSAAIRYGQIRFKQEFTITAVARRMLSFFESAVQ